MPSLGMRRASEEKTLPLAYLVVILAVLSSLIGRLLMFPGTITEAKIVLSIGLAINLIMVFGILFLLTAIFHLVADIRGGSGKGSALYTVFSLALLPFWLLTPLAIILKSLGKEGFLVFLPLWLIILGWTVSLFIIGIREVYHISWEKTAAIFIYPLVGIGLALTILFLLFVAALFLSLTDIFRFFPFAMNYI